MSGDPEKVKNYLEVILPAKIIKNNVELNNCNIVKCISSASSSLDGFLSSIFQLQLEVEDKTSKRKQTLNLIVKLLKGEEKFRKEASVNKMTMNELEFYSNVIPCYENFLKESGGLELNCTPKFYYGFYGFDKDLGSSESPEGVFVFENLINEGYRHGSRDKLDEKHIMLLTESIAKLHATSFALKIQNKEKFDQLIGNFKIIPFYDRNEKSINDALYHIALERLHQHVMTSYQPEDFKKTIVELNEKFKLAPAKLLETFVDDESVFNILIHGDYNRNNVMFKYDSPDGFDNPTGLKMFDFQYTKFASPALDLSFYLYMNLDPEIMETLWDKILKFYHETLILSLTKILQCNENDERLKPLNFDDFLQHFNSHAFYGCMVSVHFLPIMMCDVTVLPEILAEFNEDFFSEKSKQMCIPAGGKEAIDRVTNNVKHAFKRGYINRLLIN